jgi:hypothetical protein
LISVYNFGSMKKSSFIFQLFILLLFGLVLVSCGFQGRKYTTGIFLRDLTKSRSHSIANVSSIKSQYQQSTLEPVQEGNEALALPQQNNTTSASIEEIDNKLGGDSEGLVQKTQRIEIDTNGHELARKKLPKEERKSLRRNPTPNEEMNNLIKKRRIYFALCLPAFALTLILGIIFYPSSGSAFAFGLAGVLSGWAPLLLALKQIAAIFRIHRFMKKQSLEEQLKPWYQHRKKLNRRAALLLPILLGIIFMAGTIFGLGIFIVFDLI